jgi:phosphoglycolate phosphatase
LAESANHALKQLGYPTRDVEKIRTFVGNGVNKLLFRALPDEEKTEENMMRMRTHFVPYYDAHNADLSAPYPGIVALLEELQAKGLRMAVASNKYQEATVKLVKHYFPMIDFVEVLGQREGINVKPDPTIVFDILKKAGVSKEETLYVGDSGVDMQTAINAGVDAIGVTWGFRPRTELEDFHPMGLIDQAEELLGFV